MIVAHDMPTARSPERHGRSIGPQSEAYGAVNEFPQVETFGHRESRILGDVLSIIYPAGRTTATPPLTHHLGSPPMASDPYSVYNRPAAHYDDDHNEPVHNPYSFTAGHDDYHHNHYTGYRDDTFVPPAENPPISEKHVAGAPRMLSPVRTPHECVMRICSAGAAHSRLYNVSKQIEQCGAFMEAIRTRECMDQGGVLDSTPPCQLADTAPPHTRDPERAVAGASFVAP